jgi:hypothetical protein
MVDMPRGPEGLPAAEAVGELGERYGLDLDMEDTERIRAELDLRFDPLARRGRELEPDARNLVPTRVVRRRMAQSPHHLG